MKTLKRNHVTVWYCKYLGKTNVVDSDGYKTGEKKVLYSEPIELKCNVHPATGQVATMMFGNLEGYDRIIVTEDTSIEIDENSVFYIDNPPASVTVMSLSNASIDDDGYLVLGDDSMSVTDGKYDYIVKRVAKSLNSVSIAVSKVKTS